MHQAPCKQYPGNVWYSFRAYNHTIGVSAPPGCSFTLDEEWDGELVTLRILDEGGNVATNPNSPWPDAILGPIRVQP